MGGTSLDWEKFLERNQEVVYNREARFNENLPKKSINVFLPKHTYKKIQKELKKSPPFLPFIPRENGWVEVFHTQFICIALPRYNDKKLFDFLSSNGWANQYSYFWHKEYSEENREFARKIIHGENYKRENIVLREDVYERQDDDDYDEIDLDSKMVII